jgi:hypothetical protein
LCPKVKDGEITRILKNKQPSVVFFNNDVNCTFFRTIFSALKAASISKNREPEFLLSHSNIFRQPQLYGVLPQNPQHYFMAWHGADITFNRLIDEVFKDVINDPVNTTYNDSENGAL